MDSFPKSSIRTEALVVEQPGSPFILQKVILDTLQPQELLVEIKYSGLCHTDLVVQGGHMPFGSFPAVLGHEGAGIIRGLGVGLDDSGLQVGDSVILSYCSCMKCPACKDGRKGACESIAPINFIGTRGDSNESAIRSPDGRQLRGTFFGQSSFSRLAIVDFRAVVKYSGPAMDLAYLAPLGCGYMTGAATVMNVLKPKPTSSLVIFGLGAVGLSALMAAKHMNVQNIVAVDIIESRLQLASRLGATHTLNSEKSKSIESAILELLPRGSNFIIDATGLTNVIDDGMRALAHGGTFALVGTPRPHEVIHVDALSMLTQCKSVIGVTGGYCDPQQFIPLLVLMFQSGGFPVDELCKTYPVSKIEEAIEDMKSGKVVKPVLLW